MRNRLCEVTKSLQWINHWTEPALTHWSCEKRPHCCCCCCFCWLCLVDLIDWASGIRFGWPNWLNDSTYVSSCTRLEGRLKRPVLKTQLIGRRSCHRLTEWLSLTKYLFVSISACFFYFISLLVPKQLSLASLFQIDYWYGKPRCWLVWNVCIVPACSTSFFISVFFNHVCSPQMLMRSP